MEPGLWVFYFCFFDSHFFLHFDATKLYPPLPPLQTFVAAFRKIAEMWKKPAFICKATSILAETSEPSRLGQVQPLPVRTQHQDRAGGHALEPPPRPPRFITHSHKNGHKQLKDRRFFMNV